MSFRNMPPEDCSAYEVYQCRQCDAECDWHDPVDCIGDDEWTKKIADICRVCAGLESRIWVKKPPSKYRTGQ